MVGVQTGAKRGSGGLSTLLRLRRRAPSGEWLRRGGGLLLLLTPSPPIEVLRHTSITGFNSGGCNGGQQC